MLSRTEKIEAKRGAVEKIISDFREASSLLCKMLLPDGPESANTYDMTGVTVVDDWYLSDPHEPHLQFMNRRTGAVIEAYMYSPEQLDPYFLMLYARTSKQHPEFVELVETEVETFGFSEFTAVCEILEVLSITYGVPGAKD